MMYSLLELKNKVNKQIGKKEQIESDISQLKIQVKNNEKQIIRLEQAKEIIHIVGLNTQQQLQFHISDITSIALESIFPDPYKLLLEFEQKRNQTECNILFERDNNKVKPIDASGGGVIDIAALALRIASWSMQIPRTRNTILLDEPFKHLSDNLQEAASEMIKELSTKLGIQFIIVSHKPMLTTFADKIFETTIKKGITKIK